jgi:metallophosphoesterase (TIGR00282 family)
MIAMRILFLGDIVGRSGRQAVYDQLPQLRHDLSCDCVIVNGENAAGGFGITGKIADELVEAGVDVITLGNHAFDQKQIIPYLDRNEHIIRPANFPPHTPGKGSTLVTLPEGQVVYVINLMGRLFMDALDDPFQTIDLLLSQCPLKEQADAVLIDFHAETTSEKNAFAHYVDGRASLVVGTHTHIPTADHRILRHGTATITDLGMCGDYDSVIGMEKDEPIYRFATKMQKERFSPALGEATICGALVDIAPDTGLAKSIHPLRLGGVLQEIYPQS